MIGPRLHLAALIVVAAVASPNAAQQPAQGTQGQEPHGPAGQHEGMMGAGHDAGIMTGVHEMFVGYEQLTRSVTVLARASR